MTDPRNLSNWEERLDFERSAWEHARVQFVIKHFRLQRHRHELLEEAPILHGARHLTFDGFAQHFPTFPIRLVTENLGGQKPLHRDQKAVLPYWFKSFTELPFMPPYEEALTRHMAFGRPVGMIFLRSGFKQGLVIHNGGENYLPEKTSCFLHRYKLHNKLWTLHVMPFHILLKQIDWEPED